MKKLYDKSEITFAIIAIVVYVVTMVFYKSGSLLPNILMHSMVDVFSLFSNSDALPWVNWTVRAVVIIISIIYCLYLAKRVETPAINR